MFTARWSNRVVKVYCCGLTPYGEPHVGHLRTILTTFVMKRALINLGYRPVLAINWTDIDLKIGVYKRVEVCLRVADLQVALSRRRLTNFLATWEVDYEPRVSRFIGEITSDILALKALDKADDKEGSVYLKPQEHVVHFRSHSVKTKGGFVLWRFRSDSGLTNSAGGRGIPGWHIECVTMIHRIFGGHVDVHVGGRDLQEVHHVNENLLFNCLHGRNVTKDWVHVGLVLSEGVKMSKSLGNFYSLSKVPQEYQAAVRLKLLACNFNVDCSFNLEDLGRVSCLIPEVTAVTPWPKRQDLSLVVVRGSSLLLRSKLNLSRVLRALKAPRMSTLIFLRSLGVVKGRALSSARRWASVTRVISLRSNLRKRGRFDLADGIRTYLSQAYLLKLTDTPGDRVEVSIKIT